MRQSQTEIKAIEAELKSIRAERSPSQSVKLFDVRSKWAVTGKEPADPCPYPSTSAPTDTRIQNEQASRGATLQEEQNQEHKNQDKTQDKNQEYKQRRVECFPFPAHSAFEHPHDAIERNSAPASRQASPRQANSRHNSPPAATILSVAQLEEQLAGIGSPWQEPHPREEFVPDRQVEEQFREIGEPSAGLQKKFIQQLIEEKAKQINQLSSQQETAILELIQISDQIKPEGKQAKRQLKRESVRILECESAEIPYVERNPDGTLVLTHRPIYASCSTDGFPAYEPSVHGTTVQANSGSQKLPQQSRRSRSGKRHRWFYGIGRYGWRLVRGWLRVPYPARLDKIESSRDSRIGEPTLPDPQASPVNAFSLQLAVLLVVASALVRFLLDQLVVIYPILWFPSVVVMVLPAALAVHQVTVKPPVGFAWGYRLFAILIGLLLGGRL